MKILPDGIYVSLSPLAYFGQDRLGSTDLSVLHNRPADWFYSSRHNPFWGERKASDEMNFGSALHALLLEGEPAYEDQFRIQPDEYPDAKTGEMKPWHGGANWCRAWLAKNEAPGRTFITADMDRRIRHMALLIQHHPDLGEPMRAGLSEVSILWTTADGIKLRARFDKLLPRFVVDLKTYGGDGKGHTATQECMGLVAQRHMDVQRFLYAQARDAMRDLIERGSVFGATPDQQVWLARVAAVDDWRWCWIFYRRRDDAKGHAPMVKPILRSHGDLSFRSGERKVAVALQNYRTFVNRFGFDTPWAVIEPADEPADHEFPPWIERVSEPVTFPEPAKVA